MVLASQLTVGLALCSVRFSTGRRLSYQSTSPLQILPVPNLLMIFHPTGTWTPFSSPNSLLKQLVIVFFAFEVVSSKMLLLRSATLSSFLRRFSTHIQGRMPIRVGYTANAGRGVFAVRDIGHRELIHIADPLVAHPSLASLHKSCYFCLKGLKRPVSYSRSATAASTSQGSPTFCTSTCEKSAQVFYATEQQVDWAEFHDYCSTYGVRFPLIAKRLACMVSSSGTSPSSLDILSHVNLSHGIPADWITERKLLCKALSSKAAGSLNLSFLTDDWYAGVLARLHINAFRVERVGEEDFEDILAATAASILGDNIVGSAVYVLPSMYNHDCDPNVDILWPDNATANLVARRSIKSGEELHITYIDASMAPDERRRFLEEHYGFTCKCARCRDGD